MKLTDNRINQIKNIIDGNRLVSDRISELRTKGFEVKGCHMGSGGKGQIKHLRNETRIQLGYGRGKSNFAYVAVFKPVQESKRTNTIYTY